MRAITFLKLLYTLLSRTVFKLKRLLPRAATRRMTLFLPYSCCGSRKIRLRIVAMQLCRLRVEHRVPTRGSQQHSW